MEEDLRYLLGLLNSRLLTFRFRGLAKLTGENMWEAFDNSIAELPIRRINFDDEGDRERHDEIVQCSHDLETSIAVERAAISAADQSLAARRIEGQFDRLDELVLDLYGVVDPEQRTSVLAMGAPL